MASAFLCEGTSSHGSSSIAPQITDPFASPLKKLETIKTTSAKKPNSKKMDRFGTSRVQNFLSLNLNESEAQGMSRSFIPTSVEMDGDRGYFWEWMAISAL
ncbi:hypothetical protein AMTR_s00006p00267360 [Amborella trichopoda]|uniref:Uncharacterized protein n=1 Tax=Amborella trichopoda TaxID=13333 RepID=W1PD73_AMBTC|nr:hypothetical protein AMTR_s00006p00267360 [Amborella trichopoda]